MADHSGPPIGTGAPGATAPGATGQSDHELANSDQTELAELERLQLGHEIHDSLVPYLFASSAGIKKLISEWESSAGASRLDQLGQIDQWVDAAMARGRSLLTQLYPPELEGRSWDQAAREALARLMPEIQSARIQWNIDPATVAGSPRVALAAYRIVVEACRNAINHGDAKEIIVSSTRNGQDTWLEIKDNGTGFDPDAVAAGHYGVLAMKSRARLAGGQLKVSSQPGGPTRVVFGFPS